MSTNNISANLKYETNIPAQLQISVWSVLDDYEEEEEKILSYFLSLPIASMETVRLPISAQNSHSSEKIFLSSHPRTIDLHIVKEV